MMMEMTENKAREVSKSLATEGCSVQAKDIGFYCQYPRKPLESIGEFFVLVLFFCRE